MYLTEITVRYQMFSNRFNHRLKILFCFAICDLSSFYVKQGSINDNNNNIIIIEIIYFLGYGA